MGLGREFLRALTGKRIMHKMEKNVFSGLNLFAFN